MSVLAEYDLKDFLIEEPLLQTLRIDELGRLFLMSAMHLIILIDRQAGPIALDIVSALG